MSPRQTPTLPCPASKLSCTAASQALNEHSEHTFNQVLSCGKLCSAPGSARLDTPTDPSGDVSSILESLGHIAFKRGMDKLLSKVPLDEEGRAVLRFKSPAALCAEAWYWGTPSTGPTSSQRSGHSSPSTSTLPTEPDESYRLPVPPRRREIRWVSTYRAPEYVEMDEAKARGETITKEEANARVAAKFDAENKLRREALARDEVAKKAAWTPGSSPCTGTTSVMDSSNALSSALPEEAQSPHISSGSTLKRRASVGIQSANVANGAILPRPLPEQASATSTCSEDSNKPLVPNSNEYSSLRSRGPLKRAFHEDDASTFCKRYKLSEVA